MKTPSFMMLQKRKSDGNQPDTPRSDTKLKHLTLTYSNVKTTTFFVISIFINGVVTDEVKSVSVMEGHSVTLHTDITDTQREDVIEWRFGDQLDRIAQINREANTSKLYDGTDGRFRDKLKLNTGTGDLTITNITTQHTGLYKVEVNRAKKIKTIFNISVSLDTGKLLEDGNNINVNDEDQSSGLSSGVVAGLCVFLLVLVFALAVAVFLYKRLSRTTRQRVSKDEETVQD